MRTYHQLMRRGMRSPRCVGKATRCKGLRVPWLERPARSAARSDATDARTGGIEPA
jgi:hypothetical protein